MLLLAGTFLISALAAFVAMPRAILWLRARSILDVPNERSSHELPVPCGGGLVILAVCCLVMGSLMLAGASHPDHGLLLIMPALLGLTALGFLDDMYSLRVSTRVLVQGAIAAAVLALGGLHLPSLGLPLLPEVSLGWTGWLFAWLWLVGVTNVFNFMDGIDGLAGSQAIIVASGVTLLALTGGDRNLALLALAVAGGCLGFLPYNLKRARVFLGDAGSLPLGFFLGFAILRVAGSDLDDSRTPGLTALLVWPLLFDAALTLTRRLRRREPLGAAHREHLYQLLVRTGLPHVRVTAWYAAAGLLFTGLVAACALAPSAVWSVLLYMALLASGVLAAWAMARHGRLGERAADGESASAASLVAVVRPARVGGSAAGQFADEEAEALTSARSAPGGD